VSTGETETGIPIAAAATTTVGLTAPTVGVPCAKVVVCSASSSARPAHPTDVPAGRLAVANGAAAAARTNSGGTAVPD
jgi:hypothetical protein